MPAVDNYTVCYQGVLRIYRNSVVRRLRERFAGAFGDSALEALRSPLQKEWATIVASSDQRRSTGQFEAPLVDDYDRLSVNHFYPLFEKYFEIIFDCAPEHKQQQRQAVLSWTKEIKDLRDPVSHPPEHDIPWPDAFRMLDSARRVVAIFDAPSAAQLNDCIQRLEGGLVPEEVRVPLLGYLPPPEYFTPVFVGRITEVGQLWDWLRNSRRRRWALMGDGGKGKSAVAYKFASEVVDAQPPGIDAVIWMSAKRFALLEGRVVEVPNPDFRDLRSALLWITNHLGWGRTYDEDDMDLRDFVLQLLSDYHTLLVVDDLDTLIGVDEESVEFFTLDVSQTNSKVLITSRRSLPGWGTTTTLISGFEDDFDGQRFVETRVNIYGLPSSVFTPEIRSQILNVTDGSPLYIEDLLRLCKLGLPHDQAIREWKARGGDVARRYAIKRELEALSNRAQKVLVACCIDSEPLSLSEMAVITNQPEADCREAIAELSALFLLPKPSLVDGVPRFDLNSNTRSLVRDETAASEFYRRIEAAKRNAFSPNAIGRRKQGEVSQIIRTAVALVRQGNLDGADRVLDQGLIQFPEDPDIIAQQGWLYKRWRPASRATDARFAFRRAHQLNCSSRDMYFHWAELECNQSEWRSAAEAAEAGLVKWPEDLQLAFLAGYARSRLGQDLMRSFQPAAEEELLAARKVLRTALNQPVGRADVREWDLRDKMFRALVLTVDTLVEFFAGTYGPHEPGRRAGFAREGLELLQAWSQEHPGSPHAVTEGGRLERRLARIVSSRQSAPEEG